MNTEKGDKLNEKSNMSAVFQDHGDPSIHREGTPHLSKEVYNECFGFKQYSILITYPASFECSFLQ